MTAKQTAINALVVMALVAAAFVLWKLRLVVLLLLLSILLSAAIEPLVFKLRRFGARRTHSVLLVYLAIALIVGLCIVLAQHIVISQVHMLLSSYPLLVEKWQAWAQTIENEYIRNSLAQQLNFLAQYKTPIEALNLSMAQLTKYAIASIAGVVTVFVFCFYWISEKPLLRRLILTGASDETQAAITNTWNNVEAKLGGWVRGQFILCFAIGAASFIGYMCFGVKYAFLLAVWAGLTEIVPVVGPYVGIAPAVIIAMLDNVWTGIFVALFGFAIQFIENNFLVPRVMNKAVGLTPMTVMLAIMTGGLLFGIPGALLAVPLAAAVEALLEDILSFRHKKAAATEAPLIVPSTLIQQPEPAPDPVSARSAPT